MTTYFKRSCKDSKSHSSDNSTHHSSTNHYSSSHPDRHKCKSCNNNEEVNEIINQNCTSNCAPSEHENNEECCDWDGPDTYLIPSLDLKWLSWENEIIKVKLSNTKYGTNFPVTINSNHTIFFFDTGATISCMSKTCFEKLDPKPTLKQTHTLKVNGTDSSSHGPLGTTACTLEFPRKFQQQFIVCKHWLWPIIVGLDFSHNYLIGIDWLSTEQLHLHQGPQSIVISDPTPFPSHINQISTLPSAHILVKTISQVTILARTLAIVPTTFTSTPKTIVITI